MRKLFFTFLFFVVLNLSAQVVIPPSGQIDPQQQNQSNPISPFAPGLIPNQSIPGLQQPAQAQGQPQMALSEMLGEATLVPHQSINRLDPLWPYYLAIGITALLLLIILIIYLIKRNRKPKPNPFVPADVRALSKLDLIKPLIQEARAREFSYKASEIMRTYIEERFGLEARNKTTREFLEKATQTDSTLPTKYESSLNEFLKYCDLAKFAKQVMPPDQLSNMFAVAHDFIKDTRPSIMAADNELNTQSKKGKS